MWRVLGGCRRWDFDRVRPIDRRGFRVCRLVGELWTFFGIARGNRFGGLWGRCFLLLRCSSYRPVKKKINISSNPSLYISSFFLFFKKKTYLNIPRPPPLKNPRILPLKPQTPRPQPVLLTPRITRVNPLIRIHTPHQPHPPRECTQRSNPIRKNTLIERQRSIGGSSKTLPTTVELEIFVARRDEGVGREGVDGGAQVRLVGGTGYVVVGVVAEERGEAEGGVEGGGEVGEEEEEEGSGWFCEGEHVLFFVRKIANCQVSSCLD